MIQKEENVMEKIFTRRYDVQKKEKLLEILTGIVDSFIHYELVEWAIYGAQWLDVDSAVNFLLKIAEKNEHSAYRLCALDVLIHNIRDENGAFNLVKKNIHKIKKIATKDSVDLVRIRASNICKIITKEEKDVYIPTLLDIVTNSIIDQVAATAFWQLSQTSLDVKNLKKRYNKTKLEKNKFWLALLLYINGEINFENILHNMIEQRKLNEFQIDYWNKVAYTFGLSMKIETNEDNVVSLIENFDKKIEKFTSTVEKRPLSIEESEQLITDSKPLLEILRSFIDKRPDIEKITKMKYDLEKLSNIDCSKFKGKELGVCRNKKGELLENFLEEFLLECPGLEIHDRDHDFASEEIDFILENNIWEPFFSNLNSPVIFIEAKNWTSPVGKDEAVIFASKIRKRKGSVKIGIFVALSGFTKGFDDEIEDLIREGYVIVKIVGKDFQNFFENSDEKVIEFLKSQIIKSLM